MALCESHKPSPHVVHAPSVLPMVAIATNSQGSCEFEFRRYANTSSDPPGAMVDDMNALENKPKRDPGMRRSLLGMMFILGLVMR